MKKLHPKSVWYFWFKNFIPSLVFFYFGMTFIILPILVLLNATTKKNLDNFLKSITWIIIVILMLIVYLILVYFWSKLVYRNWRYKLDDTKLKIEKGVIRKKYVSIPYKKIQNVDINRGVLMRILKLSSLEIQTAGYSGGLKKEGHIPCLNPQKAIDLKEKIINKTLN